MLRSLDFGFYESLQHQADEDTPPDKAKSLDRRRLVPSAGAVLDLETHPMSLYTRAGSLLRYSVEITNRSLGDEWLRRISSYSLLLLPPKLMFYELCRDA